MAFQRALTAASALIVFFMTAAVMGFAADSVRADGKKPDPFCDGTRFPLADFRAHYYASLPELYPRAGATDLLDAIESAGKDTANGASEVCSWNRFVFTDFAIYFGLFDDLANQATAHTPEFRLRILQLRDRLYDEWVGTLKDGDKTGFAEWEDKDLKGETLAKFIARGSEQFGALESIAQILRPGPSAAQRADYAVQQLLQPKTPFSSIMPTVAMNDAMSNPGISASAKCLSDQLRTFSCDQNVFDLAVTCSSGNREEALELLGVYASQRIYLLRDFKGWMEQNLDEAAYTQAFNALRYGADVYFMMETIGNRCGASVLYPKNASLDSSDMTFKPYHFWSVAYIAHVLKAQGFAEADACPAAEKPAMQYKESISFLGAFYNTWLGLEPVGGSSGETSNVEGEQKAGALFGWSVDSP